MSIKLFLFGRPGCGKSRVAKHIESLIELEEWHIQRFKDYDILKEMLYQDVLGTRFRATERDGFDVLDSTVLDEALTTLESNIHTNFNIEDNELIIIELARENYDEAFKRFSQAFLQDSHFLFIDANFDMCKQRIHERITHPMTDDDHYVSDFALDTYYVNQYPPQDEDIKRRLKVIENQGVWDDTVKEINNVIQQLLKKW